MTNSNKKTGCLSGFLIFLGGTIFGLFLAFLIANSWAYWYMNYSPQYKQSIKLCPQLKPKLK